MWRTELPALTADAGVSLVLELEGDSAIMGARSLT